MDKTQTHPTPLNNQGLLAPWLRPGLALGSRLWSGAGQTGPGGLRLIPSLAISLVLWGSGGGSLVQAAALNDWRYDPESGALALQLGEGIKPRYFLMANPMRIVVDLPGTHLELADVKEFGGSVVERIRLAEFRPGTTRFVLEMAPGTVLQEQQVALKALGNGRWEVQPLVAARPNGGHNLGSTPSNIPGSNPNPLGGAAPTGAAEAGFVSMEETLVRQQEQRPDGAMALPEVAVAPVMLPLDEFPMGSEAFAGELSPGDVALPAAPDVGQQPGAIAAAPLPPLPNSPALTPAIAPGMALPQMPQPALGQQSGVAIAPSVATPPLVDPAALVDPSDFQDALQIDATEIDGVQGPGIELPVEVVTAQPLSQSGLLDQAARPGAAALLRQVRSLSSGTAVDAAVSTPVQDPAQLVNLPPRALAQSGTAQAPAPRASVTPLLTPAASPASGPPVSMPPLPGTQGAAQAVPFLVEFGQPVPDISLEFPAAFAPAAGP